jgi:stearoyl-CoA desaturase (delta-9 desaturase)
VRGTGQYHDQETRERYAPDMIQDRFYVWLNKYFFVPTIVLAIALLALGGWGVMLWGISLRVTLSLHATWLVNSATHMWGRRRFETGEDSRNSWWVALLTFGEGWHNNHHAHPTSARHGLKWYEIDFNWWGIRVLQSLRLARRIKHVRFDSASAVWQQVVGGRSKRSASYEQA